jgi:hypothetical protein
MNYETIDQAIRSGAAAREVPALCLPTLAEIANGSVPIRAIRHPLGFICLPVQRKGSLGVCVHLWTTELSQVIPTTSGVHSHSWDLASFVLYGAIGNTFIHVTDDAREGTHRVFKVYSMGDSDEMKATSRLVRYGAGQRHVARAGSAYYLPAGNFHESSLGADAEAATVVLGRVGGVSDLSLGHPELPTHRIVRQHCGQQETAETARIVLRKLRNSVSV